MDLEKYFDTVNQDMLISILSRSIKDGRVVSLIHKYLQAGVLIKGRFKENNQGIAQGSSLGPLLSNILLNELDNELERRGHRYIRYADDVQIYVRSKRSGKRVKESITKVIEGKLKLKVNQEKSQVVSVTKVKYLGFGFYFDKKGVQVRVHQESKKKMKQNIRNLLSKTKGYISNEECPIKLRRYIMGWINYFKIAKMKQLLKETDEWMRAKIRCRLWKQWKKIKTRYQNLKRLGMSDKEAYRNACTRKGDWRIAHSQVLNTTLDNTYLKSLNYIYFSDYYKIVKY